MDIEDRSTDASVLIRRPQRNRPIEPSALPPSPTFLVGFCRFSTSIVSSIGRGWERRDDRVRVSKLPSHRKHLCVPSRRQDSDRRRKRRDRNAGFETGEDETNRPTGPRTSSAPPETRPSSRRERDDDAEAAPSRGAGKRLECGLERIASGPILHRWTAEEGKRFACSASYNVERRKWPRTGRTASVIALRFIARPWVRKPFAC